jgi:hypothetical protein
MHRELSSVKSVGWQSGLITNLPAGVDVMTRPVAGPDSGSSVMLILDSGSIGSDPKSNSYEEFEL